MGRKVSRRPGGGAPRGAQWLALGVAAIVSGAASQPAPSPQNASPPVSAAATAAPLPTAVPAPAPAPVPVPAAAAPAPAAESVANAAAVLRAARPGHIFVINLENRGYGTVWGPASKTPYLSKFLRARGVLLSQYYAIAHHSQPNYLAQISGQTPNAMTRADCGTYARFKPAGPPYRGVFRGNGCLYPRSVPTVAGQLTAARKSWKGYMEDMRIPCRHPQPGARDGSQSAKRGDQYATRHNPFVYFEAITSSPDCRRRVVDFRALASDLRSAATTPNLSYITPNLCHDGHDSPCVDGRPGGLATADAWLLRQVPPILRSPAFQRDGVLVITFDEAEGRSVGPPGKPGGTAGGHVGALVLSPFVRGGTTSTRFYNHYSLLATIEDIFSLPRLGMARAAGVSSFGPDVFNARR
ncbi:Phosphatidylinositol-3-phosphatase [Arthrobacter sp. Bi83]|uniref:alkaline phosphatase family protein n=1 Tax=Arthrobacter sp. Bi83 TaxID=2822353 RepID=UPI001E140908|nr:alkaline phosphatase family protein [Arthrobacter sp. Bi83]CAH0222783.1 Phosphatidylinositol-3-phosphatase [Arthrobacter sp. Bi83]